MRVDKFFWYLWNTVHVLYTFLINRLSKDKTLVGADCLIHWEGDSEPQHCYLSFSTDPIDEYFDDYGVLDSDVFYYCEGVSELLSGMWKGHADGWRMEEAKLIYATTIR
jgi:hypothetical protein